MQPTAVKETKGCLHACSGIKPATMHVKHPCTHDTEALHHCCLFKRTRLRKKQQTRSRATSLATSPVTASCRTREKVLRSL